MREIRVSQKSDIHRLKELWKICFGDDDNYINLFFDNKHEGKKTLLSIYDGEIAAMLTMIPMNIILDGNKSFKTAMIYAVGTDPKYQGKGLSTELMNYSNKYLLDNNIDMSILVPAGERLFKFYGKQGYVNGFYIKECILKDEDIVKGREVDLYSNIISATTEEYNQVRNNQLKGRLYISYGDEEIAYQKKLSKESGVDIYIINVGKVKGCAAIERINEDKIMIKELLLPEDMIHEGISQIAKLLSAKEYILRIPAYMGEKLGGSVRAFGMIRFHKELGIKLSSEDLAYLGLAYD